LYSERKVIRRLENSSKILGWVPERHSIAEVDQFIADMKRLEYTDPKAPSVVRILRDPSPRESRFIRNEIHMCACDADYFLTRYAYLKDEANTPRRFQWRAGQRIFFRQLQWMEERDYSLEMQLLKARQQGMSTIVALCQSHRVVTGYGINAVSGSADGTKSEQMSTMLFFCIDMLPWWLKPTEVQRKVGKFLSFGNSCSLTIQSGNQMTGIARGTTPTCIHLSEIADYPDPETLIEASLFRAVHPNPKVFMMLESTGNSNVGWWADTWRFNKAHFHEGKARLYPLFIPWFVAVDLYPTPTWLRMHPVPRDWRPLEDTQHHANKCTLYVRSTEALSRELGPTWSLPREQAWFWEVNFMEHKAKRIEKLWLQEMPADDNEALQARNKTVFPYEVLTGIDSRREREYDVYAVVGEGIEEKHYPVESDIDYTLPRTPLQFTAKNKTYYWQLIPLDPAGRKDESFQWNSKLLVFEEPIPGADYSVAIDTAGGGGGDRTVLSVNRVNPGSEPDVQVAELASDAISAAESYAFAMALCSYYGSVAIRLPLTACEQIRKPGDICQLQMKQMGYPISRMHHMIRYDNKKVQKSKATKLGWYTSAVTRPLLLSVFIAAVENGWYKVNSKWLKEECEQLEARETDSGSTKMEHAQGKHDDRVFAAAISYFIAHDLEVMIERSKMRYEAPSSKLPDLDIADVEMGKVLFHQIWGNKFPGCNAGR
jgi:hypothetical protein